MLSSFTPSDAQRVRIELHHGSRHELWPLFELADDSALAISRYLDLGLVHVASLGGVAIGLAQIVPHDVRIWELRSLAVLAPYREQGFGAALVRRSIAWVREHGAVQLLVATASADLDSLGFYQRLGFRMLRVSAMPSPSRAATPPASRCVASPSGTASGWRCRSSSGGS